jgi:hypothetical protein
VTISFYSHTYYTGNSLYDDYQQKLTSRTPW